MNTLYTAESVMPSYLIFPRALLKMDLTTTEISVYVLLLDRARLSARHRNWQDRQGRLFLCFPVKELAAAIGRSATTVKKALNGLEQRQLISRKRQGLGRPNLIYVFLPEGGREAAPPEGYEDGSSDLCRGYETVPAEGSGDFPTEGYGACPPRAEDLPPNKNYREITTEQKGRSNRTFGYFRNLTLTAREAQEVALLPDGEAHADRVALYMAGGYKFPDPMKTIHALARGVPMQEMADDEHWPLTRLPPEPFPERPPSYP